ncbi:putative GPI biosynthesis protein Pig-F [Helianthus anomalus]
MMFLKEEMKVSSGFKDDAFAVELCRRTADEGGGGVDGGGGVSLMKGTWIWGGWFTEDVMCLFAPAASVYGSSWVYWHRIFANTKLIESIDYMICIPAYGAVIGAWFGAWPMPLDWERTWQEWPICVMYGAIMGYLVGMLASFGFVVRVSRQRVKGD